MIGHKQIIHARINGFAPTDVFIHIAPHPKTHSEGFSLPEEQITNKEFPLSIWTGSTIARRADLSWVKGLVCHLIPNALETSNNEYLKWWLAIIAAEPKFLIGIDPDNEVNFWKP